MSAQVVLDRLQTESATTEFSRNWCVLIRQFHLLFLTPLSRIHSASIPRQRFRSVLLVSILRFNFS